MGARAPTALQVAMVVAMLTCQTNSTSRTPCGDHPARVAARSHNPHTAPVLTAMVPAPTRPSHPMAGQQEGMVHQQQEGMGRQRQEGMGRQQREGTVVRQHMASNPAHTAVVAMVPRQQQQGVAMAVPAPTVGPGTASNQAPMGGDMAARPQPGDTAARAHTVMQALTAEQQQAAATVQQQAGAMGAAMEPRAATGEATVAVVRQRGRPKATTARRPPPAPALRSMQARRASLAARSSRSRQAASPASTCLGRTC
mmetsp:Transcript_23894/g.60848  ORF Transcript_23894/g.60848 Transcript_23894/m.60848 type:complete len:255 (-) Transcript_23894:147-911(-)